MNHPLVSILCITYNHEQYIRKCLESLVNQICDFSFEILIHDDASTDGTQAIIKEFQQKYPDIVKPILQTENQWSKKASGINLRFNYPRAKGRYIALCEGDDYWIGNDKLQKQVTFLENNPDYSMICSAYNLVTEEGIKPIVKEGIVSAEKEDDKGFYFDLGDLIKHWFVRPSTALIKNLSDKAKVLEDYESPFDVHLFYHILKTKKGYYSKEILAGYNRHNGGVYSGRSPQELLLAHYYIFKEIYEKDKNKFIREQYLELSYKVINLRVSGLMPSSKIQTPELKAKIVTARKVYKDIKPILKTKKERNRLYKSLIPLQLKILKGKAVNLIFNK
ncbi:glycosyltransferase [Aequorivita sp. KMM 9714]|uniref:glycosyltransferase family 2 protein n=1 Tax=Aequorivita sp. KMM 9714 TaxID=2707173 RepID=UPI0013ECB1B8|nr:glycosyltransferase [Aequorivita sp. KMM 9714]NGX84746.1 glycosyltransferase [Aequorivita sp. KMM 9714]